MMVVWWFEQLVNEVPGSIPFSRDICSVPTHSEKGRKNNLYHASKTGLDKHSIVTALKLIVEFIEAIVLVSQMTGQ